MSVHQNNVNIFLYVIIILSGILINSCGLTEPEPYENNSINTSYVDGKYQINSSWTGDILDGNLKLYLVLTDKTLPITDIELYIDTLHVKPDDVFYYNGSNDYSYNPYTYSIDTKQLLNGKHRITFFVYLGPISSKGMLNLLDIPIDTIQNIVTFNHLPQAVNSFWCHTSSGSYHPRLTWDYPSAIEADVKYYVVNRIVYGTNEVLHSDTLYNHIHSYTDTSYTATSNNYFYAVGVANQVGTVYTYNFGYTSY